MVQTMSIREFLHPAPNKQFKEKLTKHLKKHKITYQIIGYTIVILVAGSGFVFAAGGIDAGAKKIYLKLVNVGKWVIIIKGAIDTINSVANGDFNSAKKQLMGYILIYALLFALPWGMDQVENVFQDMG